MSHETAYTDNSCSATVTLTPDERRVLARIAERALAWDPLYESEHKALKGFLAKVRQGKEAAG